jgi:cation diffusion facilitator CzcD-associated flavoprotein CzcO
VNGWTTEVGPFTGRVLPSSTLDIDDVAPGEVVGCVGTDAAMLHVVSTLVDAGRSIRVFEDQPRRVLPRRGPLLPRRAEVLAAAARVIALASSALGQIVRITRVDHHLAGFREDVERRSAAALRARQVRDRWTRRQLTPSRFDRRPPLRHDSYLAAVGSPRCVLVSWPIASFTQHGIRTCDGIEHRLDVVIVAG